jgi:hypothetical protein
MKVKILIFTEILYTNTFNLFVTNHQEHQLPPLLVRQQLRLLGQLRQQQEQRLRLR